MQLVEKKPKRKMSFSVSIIIHQGFIVKNTTIALLLAKGRGRHPRVSFSCDNERRGRADRMSSCCAQAAC